MNKVLPLLGALLALAQLSPVQARSLAAIRKDGTLRVATATDIAPFSTFYNGKFVGFEVELMEAIAADLKLKVQFVPAQPAEVIRFLAEDKVDIGMNVMAITSTRENKVDFSNPTMCTGVSAISESANIREAKDLAGRHIGVVDGSIMHTFINKLPIEKKVTVAPSVRDVIFSFISGQVDTTFGFTLQEPIIKQMYPKKAMSFSPPLWVTPMGVLLREDNDTTRAAVNSSLARLMQNGTYAKISEKYFKQDIRCGK